MTAPRVSVVGIHGHGRSHLATVLTAHRDGRIQLVGVADPVAPASALPDGIPHYRDSAALFDTVDSDIAVISTPIHTHADIATSAIAAGNDVLLEKPPTASLDEFARLQATADSAGRLVQVGFQSLGSDAILYLRALIRAGAIGEVTRYSASAGWVRPLTYWARADWAGKRTMGGRVVADGVLTNPLAHATATALAVAGATGVDDVTAIDLDLYRANDIQADDTSVAVLTLGDGSVLTTAVSLCAPSREEPFVEVVGRTGRLVFYYGIDVIQQFSHSYAGLPRTTTHARTALLDNLLAARSTGAPLVAALESTGGFMRLLDAVQAAPEPTLIPADAVTMVTDEHGRHPVIHGITGALRSSIAEGRTFRAIGVPWAAGA